MSVCSFLPLPTFRTMRFCAVRLSPPIRPALCGRGEEEVITKIKRLWGRKKQEKR